MFPFEVNLDPDLTQRAAKIMITLIAIPSPYDPVKLFQLCPVTFVLHVVSVISAQKDDAGCQSAHPIRHIRRKSLRLCPLRNNHYYIRYNCIYL